MSRMMRVVVMVALMMGVGVAGAQMVDPSTGMMVDPTTDPMDYMNMVSGQPGNAAEEAGMNAMAAMNAATAQAAAQPAFPDTDNSATQADDTPAVAAIPKTAKPVILPKSGTFQGSVQVTVADKDQQAVIFYTVNGKKPTTSSARYTGPITVTAKEKVEAIAFDLSLMPSGVVTRTFKAKG